MEVSFPSADGSFDIFGRLELPSKERQKLGSSCIPAILIISGSGPIDRDGNVLEVLGDKGILSHIIPRTMELNTSNELSKFLVETCGMAVLTYDKRGIGKSINQNDPNMYYKAGVIDLVKDAIQAYSYLSSFENNDFTIDKNRIGLLGHSEGGGLLPVITHYIKKEIILSKKDNSNNNNSISALPKGLIFLAGFGVSIQDATSYQREMISKEVQEEKGLGGWIMKKIMTKERLEKQFEKMIQQVNECKNKDYISSYFGLVKIPAKWLREHMAYGDARYELREYTRDMDCLAITGEMDKQVQPLYCSEEYGRKLAPYAASLELHIVPKCNHILRSISNNHVSGDDDTTTKNEKIVVSSSQKKKKVITGKLLYARTEYRQMGKDSLDPKLLELISNWCDNCLLK